MIKGKGYEITAENLYQHELIGLRVLVIESNDNERKGVNGVIVDETQNTFVLDDKKKRIVVPKHECVFEFDLNGEKVVVKGEELLKRPENRLRV